MLPVKIAHAVARVATGKLAPIASLTGRARAILQQLLRCADKNNPRLPLWPKKQTLADRAGLSLRTVHYALSELESAGLIERQQQERRRGSGRLSIAKIALSEQAVALLFVNSPSAEIARGIETQTNNAQASMQQPAPALPEKGNAEPKTSFARIGQYLIPKPLVWLCESGRLRANQLCWLMKQFSAQGQRLEDVVWLTRQRLQSVSDLWSYLIALVKRRIDWSGQRMAAEDAECRSEAERKIRIDLAAEVRAEAERKRIEIAEKAKAAWEAHCAASESKAMVKRQSWLSATKDDNSACSDAVDAGVALRRIRQILRPELAREAAQAEHEQVIRQRSLASERLEQNRQSPTASEAIDRMKQMLGGLSAKTV